MRTSLLGSPLGGPGPKPRVCSHPPYTTTYGPEAIELAASAGLIADPWQRDAIDVILAVRPDGRWLCFECGEIVSRQNGKGSVGEIRVLAGLYLFGERLLMWSAHEYKTAMEAFRRVRSLIDNTDDLRRQVKRVSNTNGDEGIELLSGQRLRFIARSKGSGRGFSGDVNILDEAFALTDDQKSALMPTMSARPNPQVVYLSSPPLDGETGGPLFDLRARGEAAGDDSLSWRDWGADGDLAALDKVDLDDRALWAATNPSLGIRITEETIGRERRSMTAESFARERLGVWPRRVLAGGDVVIDPALWRTLADKDSRRTGAVALAVDVAPLRDHASIALFGLREDGLGHVQVVSYAEGTDWLVPRLVELRDALDPVAIGLDPKGGASSLLQELEDAGIRRPVDPDRPRRGELAVPTVNDVAAGVGQFIDAARQRTLRHLGQGQLDSAIAGAKTRPLGDAVAWGRKQSDIDIGPLVAATLARWAFVTRADAVQADYDVMASFY